ncbi:SMP-30/gluconolactonase/LRE family protein [Sphingobium subterraneum]|uniref:Sugar lactone lactonase YvrE n=1 Tax=Sphingobium subterraneum TaxID=627688 RepID=A0A841J7Z2_9SPHN|nr:SMP-30/gluconolactonase/LRE family protein [Sphingobium subterraneum]MBB6124291.1 sugar lactone lactonase YvrE [Sphingobium subterraneum]
MNMTQIEVALDAHATLGESPRWHEAERRLYWVDIPECALHRFDPATGRDEKRIFAQQLGCLAFVAGGGLILGMKDGCAWLERWDAEPVPFGPQIFAGDPDRRFNDGRTDIRGRFWIGSVNTAKRQNDAALYCLYGDGALEEAEGGMLTCNGAAFGGDGAHFCHTDTPSHMLRVYRYDPDTATLSDHRVLHQFPQGKGRPDGGSYDEAGYYWSALFDGGRVVRISPEGAIVQEVTLPVSRPTMIAFGDEDRRTAYVTTARAGLDAARLAAEPLAGAIFRFRVDVPGVAEADFVRTAPVLRP